MTETSCDVYRHLEQLRRLEVDPATRRAIDDVRQLLEQVRPTVDRARRVLAEHEAAGDLVRCRLVEGLADVEVDEADQGLWAIMQALSGAGELYCALQQLSDLCDPERVTADDIERAAVAHDVAPGQ